jgi:hypothetical protein
LTLLDSAPMMYCQVNTQPGRLVRKRFTLYDALALR